VGHDICGQVVVGVSPVLEISAEKSPPRYRTPWPTKLKNVRFSVCLNSPTVTSAGGFGTRPLSVVRPADLESRNLA
jgi:hypothetical protein